MLSIVDGQRIEVLARGSKSKNIDFNHLLAVNEIVQFLFVE